MIESTIEDFFSSLPDIVLVILFGSSSTGRRRSNSDVDIGVMSSGLLDSDRLVDIQLDLSQSLKLEVDLLDLGASHGAILQEVMVRGKVICNRSNSHYEKLLKRMWYEREDDARFTAKTYAQRLKS